VAAATQGTQKKKKKGTSAKKPVLWGRRGGHTGKQSRRGRQKKDPQRKGWAGLNPFALGAKLATGRTAVCPERGTAGGRGKKTGAPKRQRTRLITRLSEKKTKDGGGGGNQKFKGKKKTTQDPSHTTLKRRADFSPSGNNP